MLCISVTRPTTMTNGYLSAFSGLRTVTEPAQTTRLSLMVKGPYIWILDHIIVGDPSRPTNHFHLVGQEYFKPQEEKPTPANMFYLIDGCLVLKYERSKNPHNPNSTHFHWKILTKLNNIGTLSLLICNR